MIDRYLPLSMHQTVYFGNQRLILTNDRIGESSGLQSQKAFSRPYTSEKDITDALTQLKTGAPLVELVHPDPGFLMEQLKRHLQFIQAAGGLVQGPSQNILLIYRQGKWDLPKGHLDEGEDLPGCAVREVKEETGLPDATIKEPLGTTYHTYFRDGVHWLKESHWYLMETPELNNLKPQQEEDIEQCIWVPATQLDVYMNNTHPSIRDIVGKAKHLLV